MENRSDIFKCYKCKNNPRIDEQSASFMIICDQCFRSTKSDDVGFAISQWNSLNSNKINSEKPILTTLKDIGKIGESISKAIKRDLKESTPTSHDAHYNNAEKRFGCNPIQIMEGIACTGIPEEYWDICKRNLNLVLDFKYIARLGEKDSPEKELDKAGNFRHRARTGKFPWG